MSGMPQQHTHHFDLPDYVSSYLQGVHARPHLHTVSAFISGYDEVDNLWTEPDHSDFRQCHK